MCVYRLLSIKSHRDTTFLGVFRSPFVCMCVCCVCEIAKLSFSTKKKTVLNTACLLRIAFFFLTVAFAGALENYTCLMNTCIKVDRSCTRRLANSPLLLRRAVGAEKKIGSKLQAHASRRPGQTTQQAASLLYLCICIYYFLSTFNQTVSSLMLFLHQCRGEE